MPRLAEAIWTSLKLAAIAAVVVLGSSDAARTILKTAPPGRPAVVDKDLRHALPREQALRLLEQESYGPVVGATLISPTPYRAVTSHPYGDRAEVGYWSATLSYPGGDRDLLIAVIMPKNAKDAPVFVSQNFCPTHNVLGLEALPRPTKLDFDCSGGGVFRTVMKALFGRHIVEPPIQTIIESGFGFVAIYPPEVVPDSASRGRQALATLFSGDPSIRPGALAVWAGLTDAAAALVEDRYGDRDIIAVGHSRYGKTALLAGAWFDSVDGVIAHQSGTLGASRMTDTLGEPLETLASVYPHWGNGLLSENSSRPDQLRARPADLLVAMGDKPVLLGNAQRDVWSDPVGAWLEAEAGWGPRFGSERPGDYQPDAAKSFWMRPGTHGVTKEDWESFLRWASAQFKRDDF